LKFWTEMGKVHILFKFSSTFSQEQHETLESTWGTWTTGKASGKDAQLSEKYK